MKKEKLKKNIKFAATYAFTVFLVLGFCILGTLNSRIEQIKASAEAQKSSASTYSESDIAYKIYAENQNKSESNIRSKATVIPFETYCGNYTTYSGIEPHLGVISGQRDYLGKYCVLYSVNEDGSLGDKIGRYRFADVTSGKNNSIANGDAIGIWCENETKCQEMYNKYNGKVYMYIER